MVIKDGVKLANLDTSIVFAAFVADGLWKDLGVSQGVTITSGTEGKHSNQSLHYPHNSPSGQGRAIDLRIWDVDGDEASSILRERLTSDYDVVLESTHIHVEYDPK